MAYYLIDYENTNKAGLNGVESLTERDTVCIFYSRNAESTTFDMLRKIKECKAKFIFIDVQVGTKNALDFQLATYLGYIIGKETRDTGDRQGRQSSQSQKDEQKRKDSDEPAKRDRYYIVSGDNGFESLCKYWQANGVNVTRTQNLQGENAEQVQNDLLSSIQEIVGDKDVALRIAAIVQKYKTKMGINNALMREFPSAGNKLSGEYYQKIKPLIRDKKGN